LIAVVIFSVFAVTSRFIDASTGPVLSVVLSGTTKTYSIPTQSVGSTFKVDVRADDLSTVTPGVDSVSYTLTWDPTVLTYVSKTDNTWLPSQSNLGDLTYNIANGTVTIGQIAFDLANASACTTTSSVTVTFTFQVASAGSCVLGLEPSASGVSYFKCPNGKGGSASVTEANTVNATYGSPAGSSVHGPTAIFTPTDGSIFKIGSPITLVASLSQPGFDGQTCNITSYVWSVEYLNGTTFVSLTGETATFDATVLGSFRIILIVTANDVQNPSNPSYDSTGSSSAVVNVVSSLQSPKIDVFTDKGGVGEGVSCGSYGPLEVVQAFALVTSDGTPLSDESVVFSIYDANGTSFLRTGVTNETGIATIQPGFRLPNPNFGSNKTGIGTWSITALVNVLGVTVNDTTTFDFNYVNAIENVVVPQSVHCGENMPIQLIIDNQVLSTRWSKLCITLFDQAGVPIGSSTLIVTQQMQNITVVDSAMAIPSWAFTGTATVYLCLLANSTSSIPLAPQAVAHFNILP
jgi:hypothetical protein